jgi:hypothetical protein
MSSEFNRMRQLAGIKEVNIAPGGKTYYAVINHLREPFYIITYSSKSMLDKLNKAYKELTGENYIPYRLDDLDEEARGYYNTYISDDWATVTDDKTEFNYQMGLYNPPPKRYQSPADVNEIQITSVVNEETSNLGNFIETLKSKFDMSDELVNFVVNFIEKSDCQKIEFANFSYPALGIALHNGVLINNSVFNRSLEFALFVIFHEISHQYQYKKYGIEKMYEFYNDEISVTDVAKFMKQVEMIADNFASRKIRELQNMELINKNYTPVEIYKTVPESSLVAFIESIRAQLRARNITSPDGISEFYYNLIKNSL